jgi:flagellar export protein FliJ
VRRFYFRLENVLNIRRKQEEGVQRQFALRRAELLKIENNINDMGDKMHRFMAQNQISEGSFTVMEVLAVDNYISRLEIEIRGLEMLRKEKEEEVSKILSLLHEAKRTRKVIENLKERQLERHHDELNREEAGELDDINQNINRSRETLTIETSPLEEL